MTELEAQQQMQTASHAQLKAGTAVEALTQELDFMETLQGKTEDGLTISDLAYPAWAFEVDIDIVPQPVQAECAAIRLRVVVARTFDNRAVVCESVAGVGPATQPLHGDNTMPYELTTVLDMWGVSDKDGLVAKVHQEAERAMVAIMEAEKSNTERRSQSDLIGIDFLLTTRFGAVCPVVIEINDHDCTDQPQMLDYIRGTMGKVIRPWVQLMLHRSQEIILSELDILFIGLGGWSKIEMYEKIHSRYKCAAHMVDQNGEHPCRSYATNFLEVGDLTNHSIDEQHCDTICAWLKEKGLDKWLDGVVTFWEDCVPLTAMVRERLGLPGPVLTAAMTAKSKTGTQFKLMEEDGHKDYRPGTGHYAIKTVKVSGMNELAAAAQKVGFPAVVKVDHGSSAFGVKLVNNPRELKATAQTLLTAYSDEGSHGGCGLSWGCNLLLQEYITGSEHDVDVVLYEGALVCAFVTDNAPTRLPYFAETASCMPSGLNSHQQDQLTTAARLVCIQLGLHTGVFNVELKMTTFGPKVIECNGRMGGFYIHRWVEQIWGIDLVKCTIMTACGLRPHITMPPPRMTMVFLPPPPPPPHPNRRQAELGACCRIPHRQDPVSVATTARMQAKDGQC